MPKIYTVAEVRDLDDDTVVHCFRGKITKLWPPKTGTSDRGDWSFQNIFLKDRDGDEIKAVLKDREELESSWKGKEVNILSTKSEKHGWVGIKAKDDEYDGKTTRILWVTKTASITKGGTTSDDDPQDELEERTERQKPKPQSHHENESEDGDLGPQTDDPLDATKDFLMRRSNLYLLCYKAAVFMGPKCEAIGLQVSPEHFQAMVSTLFIAADRAGVADSLPTHLLPGFEAEQTDASDLGEPQEPETEPEEEPEPEDEPRRVAKKPVHKKR